MRNFFLFLFDDFSNSGIKKVTKNFRFFAKIEKLNCKYLLCPPVPFNRNLSVERTFERVQFWYKASYLLKLTNRDIVTSILLHKLLKGGFGGCHFEHKILLKYQTKSKTDFRSEISTKFPTFEHILSSKYENRYFQGMFTVVW